MNAISSEYYNKPVEVMIITTEGDVPETKSFRGITKISVTEGTTILFQGERSCDMKISTIIPNKYLIYVL